MQICEVGDGDEDGLQKITLSRFVITITSGQLRYWPVVVAHLVEWSLLIQEVRCLNPVIGKNLYILKISLLSTVSKRRK